MTIVKRVGPLPEGHPFSGTQIIFGMKRPDPSEKKSTQDEAPLSDTGAAQGRIDEQGKLLTP